MNYLQMKEKLDNLSSAEYEEFIKGLIAFEYQLTDKEILDDIYRAYMENDGYTLLSDDIKAEIDKYQG